MRYLLLAGMVGWSWGVWAQRSLPQPESSPVVAYHQTIGNQSHLYNGIEINGFPIFKNEHPYFVDYELATGEIFYQGQLFKNVVLRYNLVNDEIEIEDGASGIDVQLVRRYISWFKVHGHTFILTQQKDMKDLGFFDQLYQGNVSVLVKREKSLQHKSKDNRAEPWYRVKNRIYLTEGGKSYQVRSKKDLLAYYPQLRDGLKRSMRRTGAGYRSNKEDYIVRFVKQAEVLSQK